MNINSFLEKFSTDKQCLDYLRKVRYKDFSCPRCQNRKFYMLYKRKCMECSKCKRQQYLTAGTIMHKSSTQLRKWFYAIHLLTVGKKGMSAMQLHRMIGVTYKCAFRMNHLIRDAMSGQEKRMFQGLVKIDEAFYGPRSIKRGRGGNKATILGAVEHGADGKPTTVDMRVVEHADAYTALKYAKENIKEGTEIHTDKWRAYGKLPSKGYIHKTVHHAKHYVDSSTGVNINSVEGVWSLLRRGIDGIYHYVSKKYLPKYIAEFQFRYNYRKKPEQMFDIIVGRI